MIPLVTGTDEVDDVDKKMSECEPNAGNQEFKCLNILMCQMIPMSQCYVANAYLGPWGMPENFCFHVYAQKSLFIGENCNGF